MPGSTANGSASFEGDASDSVEMPEPAASSSGTSTGPVTTASAAPSAIVTPPPLPLEPELPGQINCEGTYSESSLEATYALRCLPYAFNTVCTFGAESLDCLCHNLSTGQMQAFTVPAGTDPEWAAEAGVALCNGESAPPFGEPHCEATTTADDNGCFVGQICTRTAELAGGLLASSAQGDYSVLCVKETEGGRTQCGCQTAELDVTVLGAESADACTLLESWCASERPVKEAQCLPLEVSEDSNAHCSFNVDCGPALDLDAPEGVVALIVNRSLGGGCNRFDSESSDCIGWDRDFVTSLDGKVEGRIPDACSALGGLMLEDGQLEPAGAVVCDTSSASQVGTSCTGSMRCAQPVTTDVGSVTASFPVDASCESDGNGITCLCKGRNTQVELGAVTAPTLLGACLDAVESCGALGHVERLQDGEALFSYAADPSSQNE